ncbi:MAG TPA: hypothetical protein VGT08_03560 [Terracidiphilus sp.]|nr:hypothetical protein [Terracidiphilus sp.]
MKFKLKAAAAAILTAGLVVSYAYASGPTPQAKKHASTRSAKAPEGPTVEGQIQSLRQEFQGQIDSLKSDLADRDEQLKQAQQAAADAQAAAAKAQAAVEAQQQAATENTAAVSTLRSTVNDLKGNQVSLATTVSDETSAIKKVIANPEVLQYKGITLSPAGSFIAAETVWRSAATGGDINTQFTGVPLQYADAAQLTEFQATGRQSRVALRAAGKLEKMALTGYYEADWLGSGITSNNYQSSSYVLRQRQLWADVKLTNGWDFNGGQGWSMANETTQGLTRGTEILPSTIDSQYEAGFVWTRQYSFRVSKDFGKKFFIGAAAENAETLNPVGSNLPTNLLIGSAGNAGGLYNPTANYSFNPVPDFIAKIVLEPGWGHWELFGISRFFRDRIYPTTGSMYNNNEIGAGIGGGFRGPLFNKKVTVGLKGLWGQGVGRYGSSTIADVTIRPDGSLSPLHGFSALSTLELNPTPRLNMYLNYGGDYIGRNYVGTGSTAVGYGTPGTVMSGCNVEVAATGSNANGTGGFNPGTPANCKGNNKDVQEFTAGYWYYIYNGPKGKLRQGIQYSHFIRDLWSGAGGTTNPGNGAKGIDNEVYTSFRYFLP